MSLDFPLLVRSRNLCFSFRLGRGKGAVFLLCFYPISREGNSGLHIVPVTHNQGTVTFSLVISNHIYWHTVG